MLSLGFRRAGRLLLAIAFIGCAGWFLHGWILRAAGRALLWQDPLRKADVIIVASWDGDAGALQAADLVRQRVAPGVAVINELPDPADRILMSRGIIAGGDQSWMVSLLHMLGVKQVVVIGDATGTESEAEIVSRWCAGRNLRVAVVVTTPDHSHRLRRMLTRTASKTATSFIVIPSQYTAFDADRWWGTRGSVRTEVIELEKLVLDIIRHPLT